jgi:site-specific DNA-methyltransferase (adenine-specific)
LDTIRVGDSRDLAFIPDCTVDLTVTSPPYHNAIDYARHVAKNWYRGNLGKPLSAYLDEMDDIFNREVFRVTRDGGYCCIVIGNEVMNGELIPLPALLTIRFLAKWKFQEEFIWNKVTGGLDRFGVTIQHPYPSYFRANMMHEHILVFRKGKRILRKDENSRLVVDEVMKRDVSNSVWNIAPVPPNYISHPCPFPDEIPVRLTTIYSNKGDVVLDPFVGSGQTSKAARALSRHFIGVDSMLEYVELARQRTMEKLHLRAQLVARWEKVKGGITKVD